MLQSSFVIWFISSYSFSDISYVVKRGSKKILGRLAYYFYALSQVFKRRVVEYEIETKDGKFTGKTPFILVMNSRNVGGFPVNFDFSVKDGVVEVYITKPGLFNGLFHYALFKVKTTKLKVDYIKISLKNDEYWCFDGERGELKVIGKAVK